MSDDAHLIETLIHSERVFDGKLLHIARDTVRLPNGGTATREYTRHPGAVMVIPVFDDGDVLIERQFRYAVGQVFTEFPAGKIDAGESPLVAAQRELREETGYTAREWQHFHTHHPTIAYSTERIEFFVARGLMDGDPELDEGEFIQTRKVSPNVLLAELKTGCLTDGKTVVGLLLALELGLLART